MFRNLKHKSTLLLLLIGIHLSAGQEASNQLLFPKQLQWTNPALVGIEQEKNFGLLIDSQWLGVKDAPKQQSLFFESSFENQKINFGALIRNRSRFAENSNGNKVTLETNDRLVFSKKNSTTLSLTSQTSVFHTLEAVTSNHSQNWEQDDFVFGSPQLENDPSTTTDNKRMFFDKSKAAFRAGIAQSDQWDEDQLGTYSIAMGRNTIASGFHATAFGLSTVSEAWYATSMGVGTAAQSRAETVIGSYNSLYTPMGSTNRWEPLDRLFVIGNVTGSTTASRTDALLMLKNGDTTTQGIWTGPGFHIVSARDKKKKLKKLSLGMAVIKELIPYQYEYKEKAGKVQFGFIAEEIETILPNLVYESQGVKSLNYQGLIPVLVNALVEQQKEIEKLKKRFTSKVYHPR